MATLGPNKREEGVSTETGSVRSQVCVLHVFSDKKTTLLELF